MSNISFVIGVLSCHGNYNAQDKTKAINPSLSSITMLSKSLRTLLTRKLYSQ